MELYAIFREGVYRHECGGIFTSKTEAKEAMTFLADQEPDGYHNWYCVPFIANQQTKTNGLKDWDEFEVQEPERIEL